MEIFIGIDQTGAATPNGSRAKPLPMCIAVKQMAGAWRFLTQNTEGPLFLEKLEPEALKRQLEGLQINPQWSNMALIVDCVLGLPEEVRKKAPTKVKPYLWELFREAAGFSIGGREFGRGVAEAYFLNKLQKTSSFYPKRYCEEVSGSNSVFQTKPYQKNIQTGTFRLWKDLGAVGCDWLKIWPFDKKSNRGNKPWLFEGYPSLIWRECLKSPVRDLKKVKKLAEKALPGFEIDSWKYLEKSPDFADSFVLAFGGVFLHEQGRLWEPSSSFSEEPRVPQEGWLLGLKHPKDI